MDLHNLVHGGALAVSGNQTTMEEGFYQWSDVTKKICDTTTITNNNNGGQSDHREGTTKTITIGGSGVETSQGGESDERQITTI